jgi:hypothetical protein
MAYDSLVLSSSRWPLFADETFTRWKGPWRMRQGQGIMLMVSLVLALIAGALALFAAVVVRVPNVRVVRVPVKRGRDALADRLDAADDLRRLRHL